jgi:alpha-tubulin suppressor-like RCC1 family protein
MQTGKSRLLTMLISAAFMLALTPFIPFIAACTSQTKFTTTPMVAGGWSHSLALKSDGTVWAWGNNGSGQLGDGTTAQKHTPVKVLGQSGVGYLTDVKAIAAGRSHSLALKEDGTVWVWGRNGYGIDDGTNAQKTPVKVLGKDGVGYLTDVKAIAARGWSLHSIALKEDGTVWIITNTDFELVNGVIVRRNTSVQVEGLSNVKAITAGDGHPLVLKNDGTVWIITDIDVELGNGATVRRNTSVQVEGLSNVKAITAGSDCGYTAMGVGSFMALKEDGTVFAWKQDDSPFLRVNGKGGKVNLTDVKAIATGSYHSLALKEDGTVWAWGANWSGELGDGTDSGSPTPVQVKGKGGKVNLTDVKAIVAGYSHSLALKEDGTVWAWGTNRSGELGDGTDSDSPTPVQVKGKGGVGYLDLSSP